MSSPRRHDGSGSHGAGGGAGAGGGSPAGKAGAGSSGSPAAAGSPANGSSSIARRRGSTLSGTSKSRSRRSVGGSTVTMRGATTRMVEAFLAETQQRNAMDGPLPPPTDDEMQHARDVLRLLEATTREDHLKSIDEVLTHAPRELQSQARKLQDAEQFVLLAASGDLVRLKARIAQEWDLVNAVDRDGHAALHAAAACNNIDVIKHLLTCGARAGVADYEGYLPLHWAIENHALEAAEVLLNAAPETVTTRTQKGEVAQDFVARYAHASTLVEWEALLDAAKAKAEEAIKSSRARPRRVRKHKRPEPRSSP